MKKILLFLLIIVVIAAPVTFAACSRVSQPDMLSHPYVCSADGYELFTYTMYEGTNAVGTMTLRFKPLSNASVTIADPRITSNEKAFTSFSGTQISMAYQLDEIGDHGSSEVLFDNNYRPVYSYKHTDIGGEVKDMVVSYDGDYAHTYLFRNGAIAETSEQDIDGTVCFDNEMLYAVIRASGIAQDSYTFSFVSPNALTATRETISVSKVADAEADIPALVAKDAAEDARMTPCYLFRVSIANTYANTYTMSVAKNPVTVDNDYMNVTGVKKVITLISEGTVTYKLVGIEIV